MSFLMTAVNRNVAAMAADSKETVTRVDMVAGTEEVGFRYGMKKIFWRGGLVVGMVGQLSRVLPDGNYESVCGLVDAAVNDSAFDPDEFAVRVARFFEGTPTFFLRRNEALYAVVFQARPSPDGFPFTASYFYVDAAGLHRSQTVTDFDRTYAGDYSFREDSVMRIIESFRENSDPDSAEKTCREAVEAVARLGDGLVEKGAIPYNTVGGEITSVAMLPDGTIRINGVRNRP